MYISHTTTASPLATVRAYWLCALVSFSLSMGRTRSSVACFPDNFNSEGLLSTQEIYDTEQQIASLNPSCCDEVMVINSAIHPDGYLKAPPIYDEMNQPRNAKKQVECLYKFYGRPGERIQLFYEDFDMYYPADMYKFKKIDCRYADSICLKFYENPNDRRSALTSIPGGNNFESISLERHQYDICNCVNVSYTPRQIMSAGPFIQVRFKTVPRQIDTALSSQHARQLYRGYLIRYKFTRDYGIDTKEGGDLDPDNDCRIYFRSTERRDGYFSSPNYPGLYPRDIDCHYYFIGQKNEKVQITFHTFDVEGVEQCKSDTKSDYVELSNFQNRDRIYSRFCGVNKPGAVISESSFFHVTFYTNNVFDGKGFQASYHFMNTYTETLSKNMISNSKSAASPVLAVDSSNVAHTQAAASAATVLACGEPAMRRRYLIVALLLLAHAAATLLSF